MMAANEMNATQMLFFGAQKPSEELYDLTKDPHEVNNIAGDPKYAEVLAQHRQLLSNWMQETDDQGQYPESDAALLAVLKEWRSRCVNPEYDRVRGLVDLGPEPKPRKKK